MTTPTELFAANRATTTVSSGGTTAPAGGTTETWTVASSAMFGAAATGVSQFHVADPVAPSEIIAVTNVSGTTWTVTRGAESTTPVSHSAGFTVYQVATATWLAWVASGAGGITNPMTTLGDMISGGASGAAARLAGNTGSTKNFLTQTGTGSASNAPAWGTIAVGDVPTLNQNTTGAASNITGTLDQVPAPAANVSLNSHKITNLANGTAGSDAAAFGQIPAALPPNGTASGDLGGSYPSPTVTATHLASALPVNQGGTGSTTRNFAGLLTPTAVKTGAYGAAAGDYVPCDTTSAGFTVTLPNAPADLAVLGVKMVIQGGTNTVTIAAAGSDVFNKASGSTSLTLTLLNQGVLLQYKASSAIWYVFSDDLALAQLDSRYLQAANNLSDVASASTARTNLGLTSAATASLPLSLANGGTATNAGSANAAYNALSPMTTLGDIEYESGANTASRLAGNTSATTKVLTQTGTGSVSAAPAWAVQNYGGIFGDGSDGAVTFDGSTTILGLVPSSQVYTMTRDIWCTGITINNGVTIKPAGFRIFCQGTVTNNGTISVAGNNGLANGTAGASTGAGSIGAGRAGGAGATGNGVAGTAGTIGTGASGAGGAGGTGTAGGAASPTSTSTMWFRLPSTAATGVVNALGNAVAVTGGGGGGGGGGDGSNPGGGGGSGGGVIAIFAWVVNNGGGTMTVAGGSGGTPTAGNAGGGGGGSGGLILIYTLSAWTAGTTAVTGGTKGTHAGTGSDGSNGGNGIVLNVALL